jgi:hypothetical protein
MEYLVMLGIGLLAMALQSAECEGYRRRQEEEDRERQEEDSE